MNRTSRTSAALFAFSVSACLLNLGCGSGSTMSGARSVSLAEFASQRSEADRADAGEHAERRHDELDRDRVEAEPSQIRLEASTPDASFSDPGSRTQPTSTSRRRIIVDGMVGQVNGRPIYANDFFDPIEDQLIAISTRATSIREFDTQVEAVVSQHLQQIVLNELFLAEAESQLTREEQQGLFAWMRHMREVTIAEAGGTRTATGQRLRETEGLSIEEYIARRRDMGLIQQLQQEKIEPRVIVSWRDVQREYNRRWDDFNPPATLRLARIRLNTARQAEEIEQVKQRLADGDRFHDVAESLGQGSDGREWQQFQMGSGGVADIALADPIKARIVDLEVGETSEAFEQGASTWWLHVAGIDQPEGRNLYEVQRQLHESLRSRRFNEELNRYIATLLESGVYDELDSMLNRLLQIAAVRYGP